ncbi:MAG TPA: ImmA/IrrE family metallo-endopeptidase [Acidimicrobiales bacterium]|jgi:Zn-dependent peptidase ImmA (M78 family)|nr:ImmA/IrrE family metallo-endopeptidase [Acidimicrobiales bacterium]
MKLLADLRSLRPLRPLSTTEAYSIAERQAARLLRRSGVTVGPVPSEIITEQPFIRVGVRRGLVSSGATKWIKPHWVILLNGMEPLTRRRFSLAHEYKHVLDHPYHRAFASLNTPERRQANERLCDYFAACLLMPRPWIKAAWTAGIQDPVELARRFEVSPQAMQVRLLQLGLLDPYARCAGLDATYLRALPVLPPELAA